MKTWVVWGFSSWTGLKKVRYYVSGAAGFPGSSSFETRKKVPGKT